MANHVTRNGYMNLLLLTKRNMCKQLFLLLHSKKRIQSDVSANCFCLVGCRESVAE